MAKTIAQVNCIEIAIDCALHDAGSHPTEAWSPDTDEVVQLLRDIADTRMLYDPDNLNEMTLLAYIDRAEQILKDTGLEEE